MVRYTSSPLPLLVITVVFTAANSQAGGRTPASTTFNIGCDTPWVAQADIITYNSTATRLALKDVRQDWYAVLGCRPALVTEYPPDPTVLSPTSSDISSVVFARFGDALLEKYADNIPHDCSFRESHCLILVEDVYFGKTALLVIGGDTRGLVYASYTLSELVLGVGAMDYWLSIEYVTQPNGAPFSLPSNPLVFAHPTFTDLRAFFINDEDLFGGHAPDPNGRSVWSLQQWDRTCQLCLRLKCNGLLVGTNTFPDDPGYTVATRRGLVVTSHHYNLLALSPVAQGVTQWFPEDYNYQLRPDAMMYAWKVAVEAQALYSEVRFTVGLRGAGDEGTTCYGNCSVADRADHVSWAINNQTQMVNEVRSDAQFLTWLWDEGLEYLESGHLKVPSNTTVIFADSGDGKVKGLKYATHGAGIYTHIAMMSGRANQLTEMVPLSRVFGSTTTFVQKKVTKAFILNVSDLLPYLLSLQAFFRAVWNYTPYACNSTSTDPQPPLPECDRVQSEYITQWSENVFGLDESTAQVIADAMATYYSIPYIAAGNADNLVSDLIRSTADGVAPPAGGSSATAAEAPPAFDWNSSSVKLCAALSNVMTEVVPHVPPQRAQALRSTILSSIGWHCHATTALACTLSAQAAWKQSDEKTAMSLLQDALTAMDRAQLVLADAEGARFRGLFSHDDLSCAPDARRTVLAALSRLSHGGVTAIEWAWSHSVISCPGYREMYNYQYNFGPDSASPTYPLQTICNNHNNMYYWPQAFCTYVDGIDPPCTKEPCSWCLPHPSGASFAYNATITLKTSIGAAVRYTTDGTVPTHTSPIHTASSAPLSINETTTFTVLLADQTLAPFMPPTVAVFTRLK